MSMIPPKRSIVDPIVYMLASRRGVKEVAAIKPSKKPNCAVYGCGLSACGALAIPKLIVDNKAVTAKSALKPVRVSGLNTYGIKHVSSGFGFSLFASNDKLYGSGLNNRYQISTSTRMDVKGQDYYISPKRIRIPNDAKIRGISSGRAHSLVLTCDGVVAFGENVFGQCGQDPDKYPELIAKDGEVLPFVEIPSDDHVVGVHCTLDTSFVLTKKGEVFAFGLDEDGQCSSGSYGIQKKPQKILGAAGEVKIRSIGGSTDTLLAISECGEVFIWGQCEYGQTADATSNIQINTSVRIPLSVGRVVQAQTTASGCILLNEDGKVFVWGVGLLGLGPRMQRLHRPTLIEPTLFDSKKVRSIYAGNTAMAAVNEEGRLFVWGQNRYGLLGLNHEKDQYFPYQVYVPHQVSNISIGPDHSILLLR